MIRPARPEDLPPIVAILQATHEAASGLTYDDLAGGSLLVADLEGQVRGYVRFDLGRPETYVRSLSALPGPWTLRLMRSLLQAVYDQAEAFGSQAVQGITERQRVADLAQVFGGEVRPAWRLRARLAHQSVNPMQRRSS